MNTLNKLFIDYGRIFDNYFVKIISMKSKKYIFILLFGLIFIASCKKQAVTRAVQFTSTTYDTVGTFDNTGKPGSLLPKDNISTPLQNFIDTLLPERHDLRQTHPELFTSSAIADVVITQKSNVVITFLSGHTQWHNTFAIYTYTTGNPPLTTADIKLITYVFPNAGQGSPLQSGDKIDVGTFEAGTSIGFVLMQDAWSMTNHSINNTAPHFCSADILNPEINPNLKRHAVLINYPLENKVLIGFEDTNRTDPVCDNDFNDLLIYCTISH